MLKNELRLIDNSDIAYISIFNVDLRFVSSDSNSITVDISYRFHKMFES